MKTEHLRFTGVCTSQATEALAFRVGIPTVPLSNETEISLYVDGADRIDHSGVMIKGGGGALLCEKLVALKARRRVIVIDGSKFVRELGVDFPLPLEVVRFGCEFTRARVEAALGCTTAWRTKDGSRILSDEKHYLLDCTFPTPIANPNNVAHALDVLTGVVEHGLFLGLCDELLMPKPDGGVQHLTFPPRG